MKLCITHIETGEQNIYLNIGIELAIEYAANICPSRTEANALIHSMVAEGSYCSRAHNGFTVTIEV